MERKEASDYPQELLDLFHEYQHGDINRRTCTRANNTASTTTRLRVMTKPPPNWPGRAPSNFSTSTCGKSARWY